jgi:hypothetical protein
MATFTPQHPLGLRPKRRPITRILHQERTLLCVLPADNHRPIRRLQLQRELPGSAPIRPHDPNRDIVACGKGLLKLLAVPYQDALLIHS